MLCKKSRMASHRSLLSVIGNPFRCQTIPDKLIRMLPDRIRSFIPAVCYHHGIQKETAPEERVWKHVRFNADIHSYRSDYATTIYKYYARDIDSIPLDRFHKGLRFMYSSEVYYCKGDQKGTKLDRRAMRFCAVSLGHNRITVVASNYIRGL